MYEKYLETIRTKHPNRTIWFGAKHGTEIIFGLGPKNPRKGDFLFYVDKNGELYPFIKKVIDSKGSLEPTDVEYIDVTEEFAND